MGSTCSSQKGAANKPRDDLCSRCREIVLPEPGTQWSHNFGESDITIASFGSSCLLCKLVKMQLWLSLTRGGVHTGVAIDLSTRRDEPGKLYCRMINRGSGPLARTSHLSISYFPSELDLNQPWHLEEARSKLTNCVKDHFCGSTGDFNIAPDLPSRLIDVGNPRSDLVRLVITSKENISDFRYAALSYCWGSSTPFTTKLSTLNSRLQGFSAAEMPLTLRETVQVTRDLGLRYLWIDSLCILQRSQDDAVVKCLFHPRVLRAKKDNDAAKEDWQFESARMHKVYGQAFLTIVAAGASDMSGGLFHGKRSCIVPYRDQSVDQKLSIQNVTVSMSPEGAGLRDFEFQHQSLFSRGWALQEWVLSTRLLVFTTAHMYFICNQSSEIQAHRALLWRFPGPPVMVTNKDWYIIVQSFCARDLTKSEDKLPALSGLAKRFSEVTNGTLGDYRAGLWQNSLHVDLLWQRDDAGLGFALRLPIPQKAGRARYQGRARAPSWSWAAVDGPITFRGGQNTQQGGIRCKTKPVPGHDLFGQVESGTLVVRRPFKMASIIFQHGNANHPILCFDGETSPGFWPDDPTEILDLAINIENGDEPKLYCLGLSIQDQQQLGIVLRSSEENDYFVRIGFFYSSNMKFNEADEREFIII